MKFFLRFLVFLIANFAALAIGSIFTAEGVASAWYQNLNKAPWTPPGWVFGAAWTFIMICFAVFMAKTYIHSINKKNTIFLYISQLALNISWNPIFFKFHLSFLGLLLISILLIVVAFYFFKTIQKRKLYTLWVVPYFIWLVIATSLNAYICFMN